MAHTAAPLSIYDGLILPVPAKIAILNWPITPSEQFLRLSLPDLIHQTPAPDEHVQPPPAFFLQFAAMTDLRWLHKGTSSHA
jgi:hypothetical protein